MSDQVKMSAMDGKKDEVEANNNNNKSVVLETNLDEASTASDSAGAGFLKDLEGDKVHVLVLFFLYVLQGIPLGLINAVPLILTDRSVSYKEQAAFSFSSYPFSMKLLWAPLVDSLYVARFGRRKSWLVPVQYLIGIMMIVVSQFVQSMLGDNPDNPEENFAPDVFSLTVTFFFLNFLAATQDIAVDGWALTMLKPKNVGYASTCNSVGQTCGWCLGYILFTTLESGGHITFSQFLLFWGIVFLVTTTLIAIFKREKNSAGASSVGPDGETIEAEPELGLVDTYKMLWKVIRHPLIPIMVALLMTMGFAFSAAEGMTSLKLIERNVPKDKIAMLSIPMIPVKIIITIFLTRFTVGPRPMNVFLISYPARLILCLLLVLLVFVTPMFYLGEEEGFPVSYYALVIGVLAFHRVGIYAMFVSTMAFFARISDPAIGGTYMTFLNTLTNLGNMWPNSFTLWFVDFLTWKECIPDLDKAAADSKSPLASSAFVSTNATLIAANSCNGAVETDSCSAMGGVCHTLTDGYFSLSIACVVVGLLWFVWGARALRNLQEIDVKEWRVVKKSDEKASEKSETSEKFKYFYCF